MVVPSPSPYIHSSGRAAQCAWMRSLVNEHIYGHIFLYIIRSGVLPPGHADGHMLFIGERETRMAANLDCTGSDLKCTCLLLTGVHAVASGGRFVWLLILEPEVQRSPKMYDLEISLTCLAVVTHSKR